MLKKILYSASFIITLFLLLNLKPAQAAFVANNLMDDSVFDSADSMNSAQIDTFLNNNFPNSCISTNHGFTSPDPTGYSPSTSYTYGSSVSAGTVISHAARAYGVNPRVILATLEKEEALVSGNAGCPSWRYVSAIGNGCPDSGGSFNYSGFELYSINGTPVTSINGTCVNSANKAGFSRQVITGTWLLTFDRHHAVGEYNWAVIKPGWDNSDDIGLCYTGPMTQGYYKRGSSAGCNQTIFYDGFTTIDGSSVHMDTGATAAFYHYTPHLHGNQIFASTYESWFGPSTGEGYVVATSYLDNGDARQWVIYHGKKHLIPDTNTKVAWSLQSVNLLQWDGAYLGSFQTDSQPLSRLMRPSGTLDVYFVDNGNCYKIVSTEMLNAWNFNSNSILNVSIYLGQVPSNQGALSYEINHVSNSTDIHLVDGGSKRRYGDGNILTAWEGDEAGYKVITLSDAYFNSMGSGSDINSTKVTDGSAGATEYQVVAAQKLPESYNVAQLYPGVAQVVSPATINRLVPSAPASQFVKTSSSPTIYMVDSSTKHAVASPEVLRAWGAGANPPVNVVSQGNINLLASGSVLNTFEADVGGQLYLMDGRKISIPANLDSGYRTSSNVYSASSALINLSPVGETASNFLKGFNGLGVYLMDAGSIRNIRTPNELNLWSNGETITSVSNYVLNQFTSGSSIGAYITDGTTEYLVESAKKHSVSGSVNTNWQIAAPDSLSSSTLSRFQNGAALGNSLQSSGKYYFVHQGAAFMTVDPNVADTWGVKNATTMSPAVVPEFLTAQMMTRFAKSKLSNDARLFAVDNGVLYHLSPGYAANLGLNSNQPLMAVDPEAITASITVWDGIVVRDAANKAYVIDAGTKRLLPDGTIRNFWTNNDSISTPQMTNGFLNLLPTQANIERAIKGSGPNIYAAEAMTKSWIQSWTTYQTSYAPYAQVSNWLLSVLPNGTNIP